MRTGPAAPGAVMFMRSSKEAMVKERKGRGRLSVGAYSLEKKDKSTRSTATGGAVEIAAFGCGVARLVPSRHRALASNGLNSKRKSAVLCLQSNRA